MLFKKKYMYSAGRYVMKHNIRLERLTKLNKNTYEKITLIFILF